MNLENPENVKCERCNCYRSEESFFNNKGRRLKTCQNCRDMATRSREKCKCEHGRRRNLCKDCEGTSICNHNRIKSSCKECGGTSICNHNRLRSQCKECGGSQICNHNRIRSKCKECGGASICNHNRIRNTCKECSDPIKLTIKTMLYSAKANDRKYNRYDAVNFVDYCFIENLLDDYKCCYYEDCKKELQIMEYNNSLASIERLNNNIGHIKSNCVICCLDCNMKKKSNETTH